VRVAVWLVWPVCAGGAGELPGPPPTGYPQGYPQIWEGCCGGYSRPRRLSGVSDPERSPDRPIDLGVVLRSLRRTADLSQRQLAEAAGVPATTIARIESGRAVDPKFRTVERLARAAGAELTIGQLDEVRPVLPHPDEELTDAADRHYPAHLDVRPVLTAADWWGAWWVHTSVLPRARWPRESPDHTFDLRRDRRDARRWRKEARQRVLAADLAQVADWQWTATLPDGTSLGLLVAIPRGDDLVEVLHLEVHRSWRALGLGKRLLEALGEEVRRTGRRQVRVLVENGPTAAYFLLRGFRYDRRQPLRVSRILSE
jgi:transcriptional regulator with XRE-family HTH domain